MKTHAEVVVVELARDGATGRGECVPYARYRETVESVVAQLEAAAQAPSLEEALAALPAGAARNALDCAAWDLRARITGRSVAELLGLPAPRAVPTAVTISLDHVEAMRAAAAEAAHAPLLKVKLDAHDPAARLLAVAGAAPAARLIADPNESWTAALVADMAPVLARTRVVLLEQPLPAGKDDALEGIACPVPICADESLHTRADLAAVARRYQAVNIKLDKAGGLTEAAALLAAARAAGPRVMVGCMVASSLAIAPALPLAAAAEFVDLDGPWWLARDRDGGCRFEGGVILPPQPGFWGDPEP